MSLDRFSIALLSALVHDGRASHVELSEKVGLSPTLPFGIALADRGMAAIEADPHLAAGLNVHRGEVTSKAVADSFGIH